MIQRLRPQFNEFIRSVHGPAGLALPQQILAVYHVLAAHETAQGRSCGGGLYFGGLFTSLLRRESPRDVDIVMRAPQLVTLAECVRELRAVTAASYSERREINEELEYLQARMFADNTAVHFNADSITEAANKAFIGSCFQVTAWLSLPDAAVLADVLFVKEDISPDVLLASLTDAPVRAAGYDAEKGEYLYHRHFESDAAAWSFRPFDPAHVSAAAIKKARDKGMSFAL